MASYEKQANIGLQEVKYVPRKIGEFKPEFPDKKKDTGFLYFTIFTVMLLGLSASAAYTWPSSAIPNFTSNDTNVNPLGKPASTVVISRMVAIPLLIGLVGSLVAPLVSDILGRKRTLQVLGLGMLFSDVILAFSNHTMSIIISRSVFFVCSVGTSAVVPIYITEVCESHNRAKFGCLIAAVLPVGNLYSFLFGSMYSVKIFTLIIGAPVVVFLIFFCFTCETPVFLLSKGKTEECLQGLRKLRSNKSQKEIQMDFEEIDNTLKDRENMKKVSVLSIFKIKQGRVGLLLAMIPMLLHYVSGVTIILIFLRPVFNAADTSLSGSTASVIVGSVKVCCFGLSVFVVEKMGRKTLMLISSIGCAISFIIVGIYFYLMNIHSPIISSIQWVPLVGILANIIFFSIGIGPLPTIIMGELFSSELRSAGVSFIMTLIGIIVFLLNYLFPLLSEYAGIHWCVWLFSINCLVGAFCIFMFLPETGGKSILEIQEIIKKYKFNLKRPV